MKKKKKTAWYIRLRLISQTFFVLLFLALFLQTAFHVGSVPGPGVDLFFHLDPLALLSVWISGHPVSAGMLLALIWVAITIVFGRWFCGWFCPFGALHNLFGSWRGGKVKAKIAEGDFSRWQHAKYLVLLAVVVSSLVGANLAGWFDPFSYLFRSLTMSIYPAVNVGLDQLFGWLYGHNVTVAEPVYRWLHFHLLTVSSPRYLWSMMFGALFGVIIVLNFFRLRFWCKYICPLGALLGVFGKNPLLRLTVDPARCTDCGLCVTECQGAASPNHQGADWKPTECMYCLNCQESCSTSHAISFRFAVPGGAIGAEKKQKLVQVAPAAAHNHEEEK